MKTILIIDDEPQIRLMLRKLLEQEGFKVTVASNGDEGMKMYHDNPTDLIITDLVMPEREGLEIIRTLKKKYTNIKIIAISGGGRNEPEGYLNLAKQFGAIQAFTKPVRKDLLLEAVNALI